MPGLCRFARGPARLWHALTHHTALSARPGRWHALTHHTALSARPGRWHALTHHTALSARPGKSMNVALYPKESLECRIH